ncbi:MAG: hypothetical protein CMF17_11165 [Idiomarinaceae bacterium]|jgi:hypothetical protein|nr:hypothetical protein [Idiomarinaceae bacterium]
MVNQNGILSHHCPCKSGLDVCKHAVCLLVYIARLRMEDYATSTTASKYWRAFPSAPVSLTSEGATEIQELMVSRTFLSDLLSGFTPEVIQNILDGR